MALYIPDATAALFGKNVNLGIFFRLDHPLTGGILRLWLGVGTVNMKMTGVEATAFPYFGAGRLQSVPDLDVIINGGASRIEFTIEGVSQDAMDRINAVNPDVLGRAVHIGMAAFDTDWQPTVMDILPISHSIADFWSSSGLIVTGAAQQPRALSLSAALGETGRSRPRRTTYTQAQQQFLYPTDTFCQNVARYDRGFSLAWPNF
jgi:hypothetical protein